MFHEIKPMLASPGSATTLTQDDWAFEAKLDGNRMLIEAVNGTVRLRSRSGRDVTAEFPELRSVGDHLNKHHVVLDGEAVVLDEYGNPNFNRIQNHASSANAQFWAFDLLYLDGHSLLCMPYRERRRLLEAIGSLGVTVPELLTGDGADALAYSREQSWEGIVAKRLNSTYQPGERSDAWIKDKNWNHQEVVIAGWKLGEGARSDGIGSLLMGVPDEDGVLQFAGRVGTGFTNRDLASLAATLAPLHTEQSPFDGPLPTRDAKGVTFVKPVLTAEVRYADWTHNRLRQPSWRGLRDDKQPTDVTRN
jgi:bifunctional non-homologous end joining protein LigD